MLKPLDRHRRDSTLFQFTTRRLRDFVDPANLLMRIDSGKLPTPLEDRCCRSTTMSSEHRPFPSMLIFTHRSCRLNRPHDNPHQCRPLKWKAPSVSEEARLLSQIGPSRADYTRIHRRDTVGLVRRGMKGEGKGRQDVGPYGLVRVLSL